MSSPLSRILAAIAAVVLIATGFAAHQVFAKPQLAGKTPVAISVSGVSFAHFPDKPLSQGPVSFVSAHKLVGSEKSFGGFSAMAIDFDRNRLLALSDQAQWLDATISFDQNGKLAEISRASLAPMLNEQGQPFRGKNWQDSESLAPIDGGWLVGFERHHRFVLFRDSDQGRIASPPITLGGSDMLKPNGGFEALTPLGDGRLMTVSEYPPTLGADGDMAAVWIWAMGQEDKARRLSMQLSDDFHPTDMARLANGDILILERFYSPAAGPQMRLRLLDRSSLKGNESGPLNPPVIARFGSGYTVDNMEALAIAPPAADGSQMIHILSDDNFNKLQQTLWLTFRYQPE